ncbi:MAG: alkaline phosphatase [Prevotellaceae bacterium]|jgi:alkaline phosphatase|nr:alkaline phosphatase [Prevotellaceae bacterium]
MKKILLVLIFALSATLGFAQAKYVFFFIGDGMGFGAVSLTEDYLAAKEGKHGSKNLTFSDFPVTGFATTYSANNLVTCSSAAGTALACGSKTSNGVVGMDSAAQKNYKSIAYRFKENGYKIGITTSVSLDHATPAAFYAHQPDRNMYYEIAQELPKNSFDFFAGAGFLKPKVAGKENLFDNFKANNYVLSRSIDECKKSTSSKNILIQAEGKNPESLPYAINKQKGDYRLSQITDLAIERLMNDKGFFLMVEGGMIDWASHDNNATAMVGEVIEFSNAVKVALDFYKKYPTETLIIVTADHETGGLGVGKSEKSAPATQVENFAKNYGSYSTTGHTGTMVPVYAIGAGSEQLGGKMDNTDIPKKIAKAAKINF